MVKQNRQSRKGPKKQALPDALLQDVAERFRALSSVSRLKVLNALMQGPLGMGELMEATGLEQSNLSRHVRELELSGCISREREGRTVRVAIADPSLEALCGLVCGSLADQATEAMQKHK